MSEIINAVVPIAAIKPHPGNYNFHPEEQIAQLEASYESLSQFRSAVLWQQVDGSYIQLAGHGIVEAMRRKGATEVRADICSSDLDPLTAKRIMLADNLHAKNSEPDNDILLRLLTEQQDAGFDLAALGSDEDMLRDLLAQQHPPTLDELTDKYGDEPEVDAFWPVIKVKVSPDTKELYDSLMADATGASESIKFAWLLERVSMASGEDSDA